MFGALATLLPLKLGGDSRTGWTAAGHARFCADLVAINRTLPLATMTVVVAASVATVTHYFGRNGSGVEHAPTVASSGTGLLTVTFPGRIETADGRSLVWNVRSARMTAHGSTLLKPGVTATPGRVTSIAIVNGSNVATDGTLTVTFYGTWGEPAQIGDYDGDLNKENDVTEHPVPYAAAWYRDLQAQRGSAFTTKPTSLVHAENMAIARMQASIGSRLPDKLRNQATPVRADDSLEYWSLVLAVPRRPGEPRWSLRQRCVIHYRAAQAPTYQNVRTAISDLIGDAFLDLELQHSEGFETPSTNTYWPVINPGPSGYDIGGGAWLSDRAQVIIRAQQPGGMSNGEFSQLMNVQLFQLVDRMLPAWVTAQWRLPGEDGAYWDHFYWDDGTKWDYSFDWNA